MTWNLCKASSDMIRDGLDWILGNGKKIKPWEDKILEEQHLYEMKKFKELKNWWKLEKYLA